MREQIHEEELKEKVSQLEKTVVELQNLLDEKQKIIDDQRYLINQLQKHESGAPEESTSPAELKSSSVKTYPRACLFTMVSGQLEPTPLPEYNIDDCITAWFLKIKESHASNEAEITGNLYSFLENRVKPPIRSVSISIVSFSSEKLYTKAPWEFDITYETAKESKNALGLKTLTLSTDLHHGKKGKISGIKKETEIMDRAQKVRVYEENIHSNKKFAGRKLGAHHHDLLREGEVLDQLRQLLHQYTHPSENESCEENQSLGL